MKFSRSISILLLGLVALTACKKEYNCHCYIIDPNSGGGIIITEYMETVEVTKKNDAIQACQDFNNDPMDPIINDPDGDNYRTCYLNDEQ